jgi:hypothetical protein
VRFRHSESAPDAKSAERATVYTMDPVGMGMGMDCGPTRPRKSTF